MHTGYKIEFSKRAEEDYHKTIHYLLDNWTEKEAKQFVVNIDKEILRLQTFPYAFPASLQKNDVRRCVVSKINTIYYKVTGNVIFIITLFDNRQEEIRL